MFKYYQTTDFEKRAKTQVKFNFKDLKLAHYLRTYRIFDLLKWSTTQNHLGPREQTFILQHGR